jgi:glycosyltransferase involved in cell wall biosynthesis
LRILLLHNRYQVPGGEDAAVNREYEMLRAAGYTVDLLEATNDAITGAAEMIRTALLVPYSRGSRRMVAERIAGFRPDMVHVHNFFPSLTPSVYDACRAAGVPVVQTLHNYRLICANALLFRDGHVCTECVGRTVLTPAIRHGCYRESRVGSAAVAAMIGVHRVRRTWAERVDRFIALTGFARALFSTYAQIPAEKISVKPNSAPDPGLGDGAGGYALYVGRFSVEKGIDTALAAARLVEGLGMPLKVAGSGPLQADVEAAHRDGRVEFVGFQDAAGVRRLMLGARVLVIPSHCYEGLPLVVPEAFGTGLPIVASKLGSLGTLIEDGGNGLLVEAGNPVALAHAVRHIAAEPEFEARLRVRARQTYEELYRPEANLRLLGQIYEQAAGGKQAAADGKAAAQAR